MESDNTRTRYQSQSDNTRPRYQPLEPRNDKRSYRVDRSQRYHENSYHDNSYRTDENRRNFDNNSTRYNNSSKFRDNRNNRDRRANGNSNHGSGNQGSGNQGSGNQGSGNQGNGNHGSGRRHKNVEKKSNPEPVTNGHQDTTPAPIKHAPIKHAHNDRGSNVETKRDKQDKPEAEPTAAEVTNTKVKPSHGHYHHKNSNKPRFAKMFTENDKEMRKEADKKVEVADKSKLNKNGGDPPLEKETSPLIDQLKVISEELNSKTIQGDDVFAKLKSGETVELDNLKQLYDKIPDLTKTELIKETEEWTTSLPTTESVLQETDRVTSYEETRSCCPHNNCCPPPPLIHPGFMPPHPAAAYYYAALHWNYHHPIPPPPVQRLASAPSLPSPSENAVVHKRYITRSTKTPGSIVFTLHISDNLRIVSVRCEDSFTMTADLCNEEGVKIAENFALHNENSPKLWEQYAFSGNHTLHFNIEAPEPTTVVLTFLHEIPLK